MGSNWAEAEFKTIDLGDKRLDRRAVLLAERLAASPTVSIPTACGGWAETQAAYRFLSQDDISWRDILEPHWQCAQERLRACEVVLCLQDTTELDFNGQQATGLGPLSYEAQRGMYLHATYAVTPLREPLGVLDAWMWAREPKDAMGQRGGIKESCRWIEGYERIAELSGALPATRLVYVADREADITALMVRARDLGCPADWLIRAQHNRCLPDGDKLWDATIAQAPLGEIRFTLPSRAQRKARSVRQQLWAQQLATIDRLERALALFMIVAWRVNRLMRLGRLCPDLEAELLFEPGEWQAAFILNKKKPPKVPPKLNEVIRLIAMLGGFLARKGDGEPGVKTIWIGLQRVMDFAAGLRYMRDIGLED